MLRTNIFVAYLSFFTTKSCNMRKLAFYTMTLCLLFTFCPDDVKAVNSNTNGAVIAQPTQAEHLQALQERLAEIKAMDKSTMKKIKKKDLRKETRAIKQEMRATTGIYISIGALIIIILLLILILD